MELDRPRKMELLYTPRHELAKMMKENSMSIEDIIFLFEANKISAPEIRMNAPLLADRLLGVLLRQWNSAQKANQSPDRGKPASGAESEPGTHNVVEARVSNFPGPAQHIAA